MLLFGRYGLKCFNQLLAFDRYGGKLKGKFRKNAKIISHCEWEFTIYESHIGNMSHDQFFCEMTEGFYPSYNPFKTDHHPAYWVGPESYNEVCQLLAIKVVSSKNLHELDPNVIFEKILPFNSLEKWKVCELSEFETVLICQDHAKYYGFIRKSYDPQ